MFDKVLNNAFVASSNTTNHSNGNKLEKIIVVNILLDNSSWF